MAKSTAQRRTKKQPSAASRKPAGRKAAGRKSVPAKAPPKRTKASPKRAAGGAAKVRRAAPVKPAAVRKGKWVYTFGDGKAEGRAGHARTCSAARAPTSPRCRTSACRCRPASPSPPRSAPTTTPTADSYPPELEAAGRRPRSPTSARITGKTFGDAEQPAARLGALRRARLDAGHDGHGAQPRPQRRDRRGAGADVRRRALRLRQLPPLHPDVFGRGARASSITTSRRSSKTTRTASGYSLDTDLTADDWKRARRRYKATRRGANSASRSRRTRRSSSGARSAPCSARG